MGEGRATRPDGVFVPELHEPLRPHPGQKYAAANMLKALEDSGIVAYALNIAQQELAAAVDNPVVLGDGTVSSNGNFHGAPVAYVLDFMAIPIADLASMSGRHTDRMLDPARSHGLPPFLAEDPGTDSGLMIAQYTQAGLVSDMKRLAVPASVDSISSSAMQEDHVSMGWHAARKLRQAVLNLRRVLAIELLTSTRAIAPRGGYARCGTPRLRGGSAAGYCVVGGRASPCASGLPQGSPRPCPLFRPGCIVAYTREGSVHARLRVPVRGLRAVRRPPRHGASAALPGLSRVRRGRTARVLRCGPVPRELCPGTRD